MKKFVSVVVVAVVLNVVVFNSDSICTENAIQSECKEIKEKYASEISSAAYRSELFEKALNNIDWSKFNDGNNIFDRLLLRAKKSLLAVIPIAAIGLLLRIIIILKKHMNEKNSSTKNDTVIKKTYKYKKQTSIIITLLLTQLLLFFSVYFFNELYFTQQDSLIDKYDEIYKKYDACGRGVRSVLINNDKDFKNETEKLEYLKECSNISKKIFIFSLLSYPVILLYFLKKQLENKMTLKSQRLGFVILSISSIVMAAFFLYAIIYSGYSFNDDLEALELFGLLFFASLSGIVVGFCLLVGIFQKIYNWINTGTVKSS